MKIICLLIIATTFINDVRAQNVGINSDGSRADHSAVLDLKSNSKGLLPPRMKALERMLIRKQATGLLVYLRWQGRILL
jgi:hypothetical protein